MAEDVLKEEAIEGINAFLVKENLIGENNCE